MKITELKKELQQLEKEELIGILIELYMNNQSAKDFIDIYMDPNDIDLLEDYKKKIEDAFYPTKSLTTKPNQAKNALNEFLKLSPSLDLVAEIMLFYVESALDSINDFGDPKGTITKHVAKVYSQALSLMLQNELIGRYRLQAEKIMNLADGSDWGLGDFIRGEYYHYYQD